MAGGARRSAEVAQHRHSRRRILLLVALVAALLALSAAWRWTPLGDWLSSERVYAWLTAIDSTPLRVTAAVGGLFVATLLMVPLTLLAVFAGVVFGGMLGFFYVLAAAMASAVVVFAVGRRLMSRDAVDRLSGGRLAHISRRLADRGVMAVAILRLLPVAPFTVFNLVAGASPLKARHYLIGSLLGLVPGIAALTLFSGSLWSVWQNPSWPAVLALAAVAVLLAGAVLLARRWLRER